MLRCSRTHTHSEILTHTHTHIDMFTHIYWSRNSSVFVHGGKIGFWRELFTGSGKIPLRPGVQDLITELLEAKITV